jgi:hypothetical protein
MSSSQNLNNIENIKTYLDIRQGLQRANRYSVVIKHEINNVNFLTCYPASISFGARATNYIYDNLQGYGYGRAVPNSSKFVGGIVMTFMVTGDLDILTYFNDWFDSMYSKTANSTFTVPFYDDAVLGSELYLTYLDLNGNPSPGYSLWTFKEIYPVECMPLELAAKPDSPLLYQVVLNYRNIERTTGN